MAADFACAHWHAQSNYAPYLKIMHVKKQYYDVHAPTL